MVTDYVIDARNPTGYAQVLEEWTAGATPNLARSFVIGHSILSQWTGGATPQVLLLLADGHGSTQMVVDSAGVIQQSYDYDAYGNLINSPTTLLTNHLYTGEQFDTRTGQYYLRARYYDSATGRFSRLDPYAGNSADPLTLHKFAYANANPVSYYDPTGNSALTYIGMSFVLLLTVSLILPMMRSIVQGPQHHVVSSTSVGGMQIDSQMTALIADVRSYVKSHPDKRKAMRDAFAWKSRIAAVSSWDVYELMQSGWNNPSCNTMNRADAGGHPDVFAYTGSLPGTVSWCGSVYDADDVNYYFFGVLVRALDDAEGVNTHYANRSKIKVYRCVGAQGDKLTSRLSMFEDGYAGVDPDGSTAVGGPVTASSIEYAGGLMWSVTCDGRTVVNRTVK